MKNWKVVLTDYNYQDLNIEEKVLSQLNVEFVKGQCKTEEDVIELAKDADAVMNQYAPIGENVIRQLTKCKVISRYGVGVNTVDLEAATSRGIYVTNVPDYGVEEVSNHALALLLAWSRKIVQLDKSVKSGLWDYKLGTPIYRFTNQTLGVIGFGRIPQSLVKKALPLGFRILVSDPYVSEVEITAAGAEPCTLEVVMQKSDFLSIHVPLVKDTTHFIHRDNLKLMKKNAVIINTARGPLINEDDLIEALRDGKIAGAALDVIQDEPIHKEHPFLSMDNVILTPHSAWYSEESAEELRIKTTQNVVQVLKGEIPDYLVNKTCQGIK